MIPHEKIMFKLGLKVVFGYPYRIRVTIFY